MDTNTQLIEKFYSAFQQLDAAGMNSCYSEDVVFSDPAFGLLKGPEATAMWEMLCKNAKNFSLTFGNIVTLDEEYSTCDWVANYTFSKTGNRVVNKIKANMRFAGGKIIEHSDAFSLHGWSKQAFGTLGVLVGWSSFFQNKIKRQAKQNLLKYMVAKG
jgi:ketosteroid isomerase-like protein